MFEIRCIVGDKKVVEVLQLLDGHTLEPPVCVPVHGSSSPGTKSIHANGTSYDGAPRNPGPGQTAADILRKYIAGKSSVKTRDLRAYLETHGFSPNGYSYALRQLIEGGNLKKTKKTAVYEVVR